MMEKITSDLEKSEKASWKKHHLKQAIKIEDFFFFFSGEGEAFQKKSKAQGKKYSGVCRNR